MWCNAAVALAAGMLRIPVFGHESPSSASSVAIGRSRCGHRRASSHGRRSRARGAVPPVVREALPIRRAIPRRSRGGGGSGPGPPAALWAGRAAGRARARCAPSAQLCRLRSYKRVDARWTRYFDTRRGRVSVFGEVHNLFDSVNARGMWTQLQVRGRGAGGDGGAHAVAATSAGRPELGVLTRRKRSGQWGLRECRLEIYLGRPKYSDPRYKGYSRPAHAPSSNVCNSARPPA